MALTMPFTCTQLFRSRSAVAVLSLLSLLLPAIRAAAQQPDVQVALVGKRVVMAGGHESLLDADKAKPGDVVQYEATYRNAGKAAVKGVAATVPIPVGMALASDSAKPAADQASLDGKTFNAVPLMHEVKNAAGAMEKQPVPLAQYRALRWNLAELAPGAATSVALRAQVVTNTAATK